jgi:hypothetical protein
MPAGKAASEFRMTMGEAWNVWMTMAGHKTFRGDGGPDENAEFQKSPRLAIFRSCFILAECQPPDPHRTNQ